jgi:lipopolysaccharide export system permease protein
VCAVCDGADALMLFHSSIRKELARSFVATLVVLITVVMSMMLIRSLGLAARGSVNPSDVIMLMGYAVLGHLSTIMTLSLFIAVTNTLSRMYRDSEMAVWFASGKGLAGFASPVFRFAWPILLAIALLALIVWPWAAQQTAKLRLQYEQRGDLDRVAVGQFQESAKGARVFFVEASDKEDAAPTVVPATSTVAELATKQARNIFISENLPDKQVITSARSGRLENMEGDQFLLLGQGQRMEQSKTKGEVTISEFEQYGILISPAKLAEGRAPPAKAIDTLVLLRTPTPMNMAELSWRFGLGLAAFNLLLVALLLSAVNPRAGRGLGLALALLAFVVYYNLLNVGFSRIASSRTDFAVWMIGLHGGILLLTLVWLAARHRQWSWRQWLPQRPPTPVRMA